MNDGDYTPTLVVTSDCHGCGVCVPVCRPGAISVDTGAENPVAEIDPRRCNLCRECLDVCPTEAIGEPYPPRWRRGAGNTK